MVKTVDKCDIKLVCISLMWYNYSKNKEKNGSKLNKPNNNKAARGKNAKAGNAPKLSPAEERQALASQLGLRDSVKEFVDEMIANPKQDIGDAYLKTHKTTSKRNASIAGSKLLKKPNVIGYRDSAVGKAKRRIVSLVESKNESIALKASESIIDRNEGKAVQKSESTNRTVEVKLDLTGVRIGNHYVQPELLSPIIE